MRSIKVFPDNNTALVVLSLRQQFFMLTCLMQAATTKAKLIHFCICSPFSLKGFVNFFVADAEAMECLSLLNTFPQAQENS